MKSISLFKDYLNRKYNKERKFLKSYFAKIDIVFGLPFEKYDSFFKSCC